MVKPLNPSKLLFEKEKLSYNPGASGRPVIFFPPQVLFFFSKN